MIKKIDEYTTRDWYEHFDKLRKKNCNAYQESGEPRYDNAAWKYEKIADAFLSKLQAENDHDTEVKKRMMNRDYVIDKLCKDSYTREEVKKLLHDAVWW